MNRRPPDPMDSDLDRVADELERYAAAERGEPPIDLASRIRAAVDEAPDPGAGWRVSLAALLRAWRTPARGLAMSAVLVVAVVGALAVGQLINQARQPDVGTSPSPPAFVSPSPSVSPTTSPSPSPSPSPTLTPIPSASPTSSPVPPAPSPSDDDEFETPEPSESDNSGPGGGGGDNSGPGGGDD
jgi:hypothetical protein